MKLARHIRRAGHAAIEKKLSAIHGMTPGLLKSLKTRELHADQAPIAATPPDANIPKVVSFPTTS